MMIFVFVLSCIYYASAAASTVRMTRSSYRFPLELTRLSGGEPIRGYGTLNIASMSSYNLVYHPGNGINRNRRIPIGDIVVGDEALGIHTDGSIWFPENSPDTQSPPTIVIPAAPYSSSLAGEISGFLICPLSDSDNILVINPPNATDYAFEGGIAYASLPPIGSNALLNHWFNATVRFVSDNDSAPTNVSDEFVP
jgi:hypothetical protein